MHFSLKFLGFASATFLVSLSSPQPLSCKTLDAIASNTQAEATKNLDVETKYLSQNRGQWLEIGQKIQENRGNLKESGTSSLDYGDINTKKRTILNQPAEVSLLTNDSSQTLEFLQENLATAQKIKDRETELKLLMALGEAYNSLGKYEQAVESAKASIAIAQELQNSPAKAISSLTLASAYYSLASSKSDYQKALRAAISGLTTAWDIKDPNSEAKALAIVSRVYRSLNNNTKTLLFAKQALKVAKANQIKPIAASSLLTLADVYLEEGDYWRVIEATKESRTYWQELQQREAESTALVMESLAYFGQGNSQKSRELAEQGLAISQEIKNPLIEALTLAILSLNYTDEKNLLKAIGLINQSRGIAKEQNNQELEAQSLEILAEFYRHSGQKEKAIATYQESISISDSFSAKAALARVYHASNLLGTAITYYKQAINKNEEEIPRKIPGLPVWLQQSFPKAVQELNGVPTTEVYRSLANLLLSQKRTVEAQQVLELLKGQEIREYTHDSLITDQPASLTITPIEEQILHEYGSLITFGQRLEECQQTNCPQLEQLLEQRAVLTEQYYQALEQLEEIIRSIRDSDEVFLDPSDFALKAQQIVEAQPDTILIYPLVLEDRIWLLWASKGGIFKSVEVPGVTQAQLGIQVMRFRQLVQNPLSSPNEVKTVGKQLYSWLIEPLEKELKANNIRHLIFSLDRSTRYIPMSAIFDGERYLIENYTVSTVLSANLTDTPSTTNNPRVTAFRREPEQPLSSDRPSTVLPTLQASASMPETIQEPSILALGVSNPVAGFPALPHVPDEIDAIVRQDLMETQGIYPGQTFLNDDFDFFALRDNLFGRQLLHIATHSEFLPGRANKSFLLLGTGERLAIPDIENRLNLRDIDLVVLSACETALGGPGLNGKEIAGISYYFLKGGANSVVASLWSVDDQSTRLFMEQFYRNLALATLDSPATKAEALRQAQLAMLRGKDTAAVQMQGNLLQPKLATDDALLLEQQGNTTPPVTKKSPFNHPYYWSAFVLMESGL